MSGVNRRTLLLAACAIVILAVPFFGDSTLLRFAARVAIYGMAALAIDFVLGYGGLISVGHAAFFGVGAYVTGALTMAGYGEALVVWPLAVAAAALAAFFVGALSLRTSGVYFIMITLAFGQMFYYAANALPGLGGADGFRVPARNTLLGLSLDDPPIFYMVCVFFLVLVLVLARRAMRAPFGAALRAVRDDEIRAGASGLKQYGLRLVAFTLSGAIAGLAGALAANETLYLAPSSTFSWHISVEFLVMVIIGSVGTLVGPILGAAIYLILVETVSGFTDYWALVIGPLLILRVLYVRDGFYHLIVKMGRA